MKVVKVAKVDNVHPFYHLFRLSFYGFEIVSVDISGISCGLMAGIQTPAKSDADVH
jgi:hypothetical protein